ncbi:MAG: hypothetical protein RL380_91 [Verrucomicrobiota bacterium]
MKTLPFCLLLLGLCVPARAAEPAPSGNLITNNPQLHDRRRAYVEQWRADRRGKTTNELIPVRPATNAVPPAEPTLAERRALVQAKLKTLRERKNSTVTNPPAAQP